MVRTSSEISNSPSSGKAGTITRIRPRKTTTTSYREAWRKLAEVRKPMLCLDERFRYPSSTSVPTLHYGLGYTVEGIMHCARKRNLLPPPPEDRALSIEEESRRFALALLRVNDYLEDKLKTRLFFLPTITPGYSGIFSLYSNHTRQRFYRPKKEGEILRVLRRELNIRKQQAAWHWDLNEHGLDYVCEYDEFNP